jgi:hypothetical protein
VFLAASSALCMSSSVISLQEIAITHFDSKLEIWLFEIETKAC